MMLDGIKDRSHYGILVRDVEMEVTPEQARAWMAARPPAPIMWSKASANDERSHRYAKAMADGKWDNDMPVDSTGKPVEPVMISEEHGFVLGGSHRLTAITIIDRPLRLRIWFWSKPQGWGKLSREDRQARQRPLVTCEACGWWSQFPEVVKEHRKRAHRKKEKVA